MVSGESQVSSTTRIPLTAIILSLNEEANISACANALTRVGDLVLVDSNSTDGTVERARTARPDVRVFFHTFKDFGEQRNWALDHTSPRYPWVLFVDADEFCSPALLDEISAFIANSGENVGGYVAGKNYFLGRWLKHTTYYPSYQLRLLKLGEVRFRKEGHGQRETTDGPFVYFREGWRHEGFSQGVSHWIARHNRYSSEETELLVRLRNEKLHWRELVSGDPIVRRRAAKKLGAKLPFRPLTRFVYTYVLRRGFMDGIPGLMYCLLRVAHDIHIVVKLYELRHLDRQSRELSR